MSFSVTTQVTAAKQTMLVTHSPKRKGGTLYKWSLELLYVGFSATAGCNFLGKIRKTVKCTGRKKKKETKEVIILKHLNGCPILAATYSF